MFKHLALLVCLVAVCVGQASDAKFYKLDFIVKEVEAGKAVNTRSYTMTASTEKGAVASLRTGSRLPVPNAGGGFNFMDVGVNIDARSVQDLGNDVVLVVNAEVSTAQPQETPTTPLVVRQNRWSGNLVVALKKPTLIFSSDDLTTKRQMQLELTATPIR